VKIDYQFKHVFEADERHEMAKSALSAELPFKL
jgi:hypothetical protein